MFKKQRSAFCQRTEIQINAQIKIPLWRYQWGTHKSRALVCNLGMMGTMSFPEKTATWNHHWQLLHCLFSAVTPAAPCLKVPKRPVMWLCILPAIPWAPKPWFNPARLRWCCQQAAFTSQVPLQRCNKSPSAHPALGHDFQRCSTPTAVKLFLQGNQPLAYLFPCFVPICLWAKLVQGRRQRSGR